MMEIVQAALDAALRFGGGEEKGSVQPFSGPLVETLQHNKVPLLSLTVPPELDISRPEGTRRRSGRPAVAATDWQQATEPYLLEAALERERREHDSQRGEYEAVHNRLRAAGVETMFIKPVGIAPSFPYTSDNLDILIRPRATPIARRVLVESGYVELKNVEEPHKFLFRKFRGGESVSAIHLHEHVGWCVSFFEEDVLWERSVIADDDPLVRIPSPEDAMLINLAHTVYENKRVKLYDLLKIFYCLERPDFDWEYVERAARRRGWLDGLYAGLLIYSHLGKGVWGYAGVPPSVLAKAKERVPGWIGRHLDRWLRSQPLSLPYKLSFLFCKKLMYAKILLDELTSPEQKAKDVVVHTATGAKLKLGVRSQPGMLISLSGVDGVGKTAYASILEKAFSVCCIRTRYVWARPNSSGPAALMSGLGKAALVGRASNELSTDSRMERREALLKRPVAGVLWSVLGTCDLLVRYLIRVRLPLLLGYVVICDRYVYDAMVDFAAFSGRSRSDGIGGRLLQVLSPKPRVRLLLQASVGALKSRREVTDPERMLKRQSRLYRQLADSCGLQVVDSERGLEAVGDALVFEVLTKYLEGHRTVINGLFLANPKRT